MKYRLAATMVWVFGIQGPPLWAGAAQQPATEAPAGFDTPTLVKNPGSNSQSNGIAEPPGDHFALDQQIYETQHDVNSGLGAAGQPGQSGGRIHGEAIEVPVLEAPGQTRIGRFGWKDQHSSLLSFIGDAYLNEMGVTNRLRPKDETTIGKVTPDPEDVPDELGLADIDHFAQFVRGTKVPPRDTTLAATPAALAGEHVFSEIGCGACHVSSIATAKPGTAVNGGTFLVPAALGNKIIHPYSDFLLHDIGTGDGIVQAGPQDTANKLRTAALWDLRMRPRYMHDLRSLTLRNAIERHDGEAEHVARRFRELTETQKQQLLTFLESL